MTKEEVKKYTLQFTEKEITALVNMINNEDVELVQRVADGQARIETINKLIGVVEVKENDGDSQTKSQGNGQDTRQTPHK